MALLSADSSYSSRFMLLIYAACFNKPTVGFMRNYGACDLLKKRIKL